MGMEMTGVLMQVILVVVAFASLAYLARFGVDAARQFHQEGLQRVRAWESKQASSQKADTRSIA